MEIIALNKTAVTRIDGQLVNRYEITGDVNGVPQNMNGRVQNVDGTVIYGYINAGKDGSVGVSFNAATGKNLTKEQKQSAVSRAYSDAEEIFSEVSSD